MNIQVLSFTLRTSQTVLSASEWELLTENCPNKAPFNSALDVDMTFPLRAIGVYRANPDVFPSLHQNCFRVTEINTSLMARNNGCSKPVVTSCDSGPCKTWEEPKLPQATSVETIMFWEETRKHCLMLTHCMVKYATLPTAFLQISFSFSRQPGGQPGRQSPLTPAVK